MIISSDSINISRDSMNMSCDSLDIFCDSMNNEHIQWSYEQILETHDPDPKAENESCKKLWLNFWSLKVI